MSEIVKICKIHGDLTVENTRVNRVSPLGIIYRRCRICRNNQARQRLNHKYIKTPKKHEKHHLPKNISKEDRAHAYTIKHRFKLTIQEYELILIQQNYVCAICKQPETQKKRNYNKIKMLSVDHCHETGIIRGLLCHQCNVGLGAFKDSIENLNAAIQYLLNSRSLS